MKFHELVAEHNIDYKFHDFEDLHASYLNPRRRASVLHPPPEFLTNKYKDTMKTVRDAVEAVPLVGVSTREVIEVAEESFDDFKNTEEARLWFAMTVVDVKNKMKEKGKTLTVEDLQRVSTSCRKFVELELVNERNNRSYVEIIRDNAVLLKDFCIRILNELKKGNLRSAITAVWQGIWSSISSVYEIIKNSSRIVKILLLAVFIVVAMWYNGVSPQTFLSDMIKRLTDTDSTWFWEVYMDGSDGVYRAEIRNSFLGNYNKTHYDETQKLWNEFETKRFNFKSNNQEIGGYIGSAASVAIAGLAAAGTIGTGGVFALFTAGWGMVFGGIWFANEQLTEGTVNPVYTGPTMMNMTVWNATSGGDAYKQYDEKMFQIGQQIRADQTAAAADAVANVFTNPIFLSNIATPVIMTILWVACAAVGIKLNNKEQIVSDTLEFSGECFKSYASVKKGQSKAINIQRKAFNAYTEARWQMVQGAQEMGKVASKSLLETVTAAQNKQVEKKQAKIDALPDGSKKEMAKLTFESKKLGDWAAGALFSQYLANVADKDGKVNLSDVSKYFEKGIGKKVDFINLLQDNFSSPEPEQESKPPASKIVESLQYIPVARAVELPYASMRLRF